MKISPMVQGSVLGGSLDGQSASPDRMARAKAIASGQASQESTSLVDKQVENVQNSLKRIKMKTMVSTNRHETINQTPQDDVSTEVVDDKSDKVDTTEQTETASEATKPISPQVAALAKAKRALQLREQELLAKEKAFNDPSNANKALDDYKARVKANALSVLKEEGVTYDQLTEQILADKEDSVGLSKITELEAKIKSLEEGFDNKLTEREYKAEEVALTRILAEAENLGKEGEDYLLIREADAYDRVLRHIYDEYKKTGRNMPVSEGMQFIENKLLEESLKWARLSKVQSRLNPTPAQQPQAVKQSAPNTKIMRTLTNRDGVSSDAQDRRARAIAAMEGRLK